tara:strand:- start:5031 stop:5375 length:345 start_codon:yes stop_codon:yes gene_type:complete
MAASFIAFEVVNSVGGDFDNGECLINKDNILSVQQTADQTLVIYTASPSPNDEITVTVSTTESGGAVNPVMTEGLITKAFNYALTANPGGVKAKVFLGKDDNGDQMYVRNVTFV